MRRQGRCPYSSSPPWVSGSGSRGARIHTDCAVVSAPTFDRAFASQIWVSSSVAVGCGDVAPGATAPASASDVAS